MNQKEKETSSFPSLTLSLSICSLSLSRSVSFFPSSLPTKPDGRRWQTRRLWPCAASLCRACASAPHRLLLAVSLPRAQPRRLCSEPPLLSLRVAIGERRAERRRRGRANLRRRRGGTNPAGGEEASADDSGSAAASSGWGGDGSGEICPKSAVLII